MYQKGSPTTRCAGAANADFMLLSSSHNSSRRPHTPTPSAAALKVAVISPRGSALLQVGGFQGPAGERQQQGAVMEQQRVI